MSGLGRGGRGALLLKVINQGFVDVNFLPPGRGFPCSRPKDVSR